MISVSLNLRDFERRAHEIGANVDQVPFALAGALNTAAFDARTVLVQDTWPTHVTVRKPSFITAALRVEPATKAHLSVSITDAAIHGRGHLNLHAHGGIKRSKGRLAIPTKAVRRGPSGVVRSQRPANLARKVVKGGLIFQETGRGKRKKLRLMFKLQPSARQPKDVPFVEAFQHAMRNGIRTSFLEALAKAMRSRR